ncbi:hypothetical protein NY08_2113 [Rhodococcus sp. B7740]|nr:hypothetical protein NY08_2113 [Rhodococcus sp. B7740]
MDWIPTVHVEMWMDHLYRSVVSVTIVTFRRCSRQRDRANRR